MYYPSSFLVFHPHIHLTKLEVILHDHAVARCSYENTSLDDFPWPIDFVFRRMTQKKGNCAKCLQNYVQFSDYSLDV